MSSHQAGEQMLGYLYQVRYALLLLLQNDDEQAQISKMVLVRRTLNKYGYPPDKQQRAVETVIKQEETWWIYGRYKE